MRSEIEALGYLGIEVSDLAAWRVFVSDVLGLQSVNRDDGTIDLRMDGYATRIRLHEGPRDDLAYAGWEVRDGQALASLEARLVASGVAVEPGNPAEAADRRVAGLIRFSDPEGNAHEAFYGPLMRPAVRQPVGAGLQHRSPRPGSHRPVVP